MKTFKFPTAFTVLFGVLLLVWIAAFFVPAGAYKTNASTGSPIPGTYHKLPSCSAAAATAPSLNVDSPAETGVAPADAAAAPGATVGELGLPCTDTSFTFRFKQLWDAPPNGLYGVESSQGFVGPWEEGFLYGSAAIFLFVLAVGAFITVTMKTEAIQTGIGRLALRFRHSGSVLVAILMTVFALGGTSYGMWEETLGFFVLLVPLALALRYDRIVAVAIIFLGAGSGVIASTVNPFATGVASDAAGISIGDGIGLRIALWIVLVSLAIAYVLWYARRIRLHPEKSVVGVSESDAADAQALVTDVPPLTGRQTGRAHALRRHVPGDDLRLHPVERPLARRVRQELSAADVRRLLLPRGGSALHRDGRRRRPDRAARRGGDGDDDRRRRLRLPRCRR